jgi:two-component system sensor histidine kinase/response regulator
VLLPVSRRTLEPHWQSFPGRRVLAALPEGPVREVGWRYLTGAGVTVESVDSAPPSKLAARVARAADEGAPFAAVVCDVPVGDSERARATEVLTLARALEPLGLRVLAFVTRRLTGESALAGAGVVMVAKPVRRRSLERGLGEVFRPSQPHARRAEASGDPGAPKRSLHILVAEDHPVNQRLAKRLLEHMGHRVETAGDGQAAVEAWQGSDFDLILMDCNMPVLDGFEAARRIRTHEAARPAEPGAANRVTIVAMTAGAMDGDRERCLASGMDDYLSKPIAMEALQSVLARAGAAAGDEVKG